MTKKMIAIIAGAAAGVAALAGGIFAACKHRNANAPEMVESVTELVNETTDKVIDVVEG